MFQITVIEALRAWELRTHLLTPLAFIAGILYARGSVRLNVDFAGGWKERLQPRSTHSRK